MKNLVILLALLGAASSMTIRTKECSTKSTSADIEFIVEPCTSDPCVLNKGKSYGVTIKFKNSNNITSLKASIHAHIVVWIPYPLGNKADACKDSGLTCPIVAGTANTYEYSLTLPSSIPDIKLVLRFELIDDKGETVCKEFPLSVVSASPSYRFDDDSFAPVP